MSTALQAAKAGLPKLLSDISSRVVYIELLTDSSSRGQGAKKQAISAENEAFHPPQTKLDKSFKLHLGATLNIPTTSAKAKPYSQPAQTNAERQAALQDPFEGLPFRSIAEFVGARIVPVMEMARDEQLKAVREGRVAAENAEPQLPVLPSFLPFTRWAAKSDAFRSTLIADDPKTRKKARLSWYHPEDTMVPRDWFKGGLLADMKYYMPFVSSSSV